MEATVVNKFNQAFDEFINKKKNIREICLDILKDICNRRVDKKISLENLKEYLDENNECYPVISYDGGNHPEYATNMYSTVDGFRLENDTVIFDIEDSSDYSDDRVMTDDLIDLCDVIIRYENADYILGVEEFCSADK